MPVEPKVLPDVLFRKVCERVWDDQGVWGRGNFSTAQRTHERTEESEPRITYGRHELGQGQLPPRVHQRVLPVLRLLPLVRPQEAERGAQQLDVEARGEGGRRGGGLVDGEAVAVAEAQGGDRLEEGVGQGREADQEEEQEEGGGGGRAHGVRCCSGI